MKVRYFVTDNRQSPFVALYGDWDPTRGIAPACRRGVNVAVRDAEAWEAEAVRQAPRAVAYRWTTLRAMLRDHQATFGRRMRRELVAAIRRERDAVRRTLARREQKVRAYQRKRARRRREREASGA